MPRGGAVAIVGADAMGKANDEEVRGDAEEVTQRRSEAPRRRTVAIQALLDEINLVGKPAPVSAAALAADRTAVQKKETKPLCGHTPMCAHACRSNRGC